MRAVRGGRLEDHQPHSQLAHSTHEELARIMHISMEPCSPVGSVAKAPTVHWPPLEELGMSAHIANVSSMLGFPSNQKKPETCGMRYPVASTRERKGLGGGENIVLHQCIKYSAIPH